MKALPSGAISVIPGSQSFSVTCIIIFCFHYFCVSSSPSSSASPRSAVGKFSVADRALAHIKSPGLCSREPGGINTGESVFWRCMACFLSTYLSILEEMRVCSVCASSSCQEHPPSPISPSKESGAHGGFFQELFEPLLF